MIPAVPRHRVWFRFYLIIIIVVIFERTAVPRPTTFSNHDLPLTPRHQGFHHERATARSSEKIPDFRQQLGSFVVSSAGSGSVSGGRDLRRRRRRRRQIATRLEFVKDEAVACNRRADGARTLAARFGEGRAHVLHRRRRRPGRRRRRGRDRKRKCVRMRREILLTSGPRHDAPCVKRPLYDYQSINQNQSVNRDKFV